MASDGEAGGGAGGESGGSADLLGGGGAGGGGEQGGGGGDTGGSEQGGGGQGSGEQGGGDPEWLAHFSASADGAGSSNRDYLKAKGFKDLDGVVKSLRDTETALRNGGGGLKVPGEGATDEDRAAFARAIGVPEKATDYEIKAPDGIKLNDPLIGRLAEAAVKSGVPKGAFEATVSEFIQAQLDEQQAETTRQDGLAQDKVKEWGPLKDAKLAAVDTAMRTLGLGKQDAIGLRSALGADRALDLMARLGEGMAEDTLLGGNGNRFGISAAEAQTEINKQNSDPGMLAKLKDKSSPESVRRERLLAVIAADKDKKQAA